MKRKGIRFGNLRILGTGTDRERRELYGLLCESHSDDSWCMQIFHRSIDMLRFGVHICNGCQTSYQLLRGLVVLSIGGIPCDEI